MDFDLSLEDSLKSKLNALIVCLSHSWGGLEKVAAQDSLDAGARGFKIKVLCLQGSPIYEHLLHRNEVSLEPLSYRPSNIFDLKLRKDLLRLMRGGVNLIHTHQPSLLASLVPWVWGNPRVALLATRHIMSDHAKRDFFHRALYSRVDSLIVMSQTLRKNVLDTHAVSEEKVEVVPLGLDFNRFSPENYSSSNQTNQRARWGAGPDSIVIGLVGRIDPAKGQATFIQAAAAIVKTSSTPEKLKFVMVGEETLGNQSHFLKNLKERVQQLKLESYVIFAGYQDNIPEVMHALDIFVMPSRQEAFGLVAIEAMAMECPIIISRGGSAEEIVGNNEYGLTVRADDALDLQAQLQFLLDHPEARVQMGKKARQYVVAHYDRRDRLKKTLNLYQLALRRRHTV